jgi:hypothetical protein
MGVGPGGSGASDDAVVLPRQGSHAQAGQLIHGSGRPLWISRGVSDYQLERSTDDPAGVIDFAHSQLESSEQVPACLDPAGSSQRNERADLEGRSVRQLRHARMVAYSCVESPRADDGLAPGFKEQWLEDVKVCAASSPRPMVILVKQQLERKIRSALLPRPHRHLHV